MPRRKRTDLAGVAHKLVYLGLDVYNVPETLIEYEPLEYKAKKYYNEKRYRQYRYIDVNDIDILLSPTNRTDDLDERYKNASPLRDYLDSTNKENLLKYTTFLNMLRNVDINDIEKVEKEQENLNKQIPFRVKFHGNYLWQIYYSDATGRYFMLVPTEDVDHSTFFYLLKKKLENKKNEKIFVPISNVKYSRQYYRASEFDDIENYLWLFTKDWPSIYEVYDKKGELSIQILGETNVYEKIRTSYKISLNSKEEAVEFYKLLKALFILQTELPNFYNFRTNINKKGQLELYFEDNKVQYKTLVEFIRDQYKEGLKKRRELKTQIKTYTKKLKELQGLASSQEIEYLSKEKQISTFLECKKSFFGKFRYYFTYNKKNNNNKLGREEFTRKISVEAKEKNKIVKEKGIKKEKKKIPIKKVYTLEELINMYKELEELDATLKNLIMDVNALKLKTKNLEKKIENATRYIDEIDSHKKSIFEFWKYSNKDEMTVLPEGEQEEVDVVTKIEKEFSYEDDMEEFGKKLDKIQRVNLKKEDTDNVFITTTNILETLNRLKTNDILNDELEENLKNLRKEAKVYKDLDDEEYDIFGNLIEDKTKTGKIKNKRHREVPKDKFRILGINATTNLVAYKLALHTLLKKLQRTLKKGIIPERVPVYKATSHNELKGSIINVFNLNPENEMYEAVHLKDETINLNKIYLKEGVRGIGFTNIIFYNNQNRTLPEGMDLSTKLIVDLSELNLNLLKESTFNIMNFEDEEDDFAEFEVKKVNVYEYETI